jgi:hypothetical protein
MFAMIDYRRIILKNSNHIKHDGSVEERCASSIFFLIFFHCTSYHPGTKCD